METSSIPISNVITWMISMLALALASYSLYVQRKDRKPRLSISVETTTDEFGPFVKDEVGGTTRSEVPVMVIHAANPTDKPINVETIQFKVEKYSAITVPLSQEIGSIPPHEKRQAVVVIEQLRTQLGVARLGHFIIIDALGNKHKSEPIFV